MVHKILGESQAGDQRGALVRGIKRDDIKRGMVMCKPGTVKAYDNFETQVYMLKKEESGRTKPFTNFTQMQMFSRTWDCTTQVQSQGKGMVMSGEDTTLTLRLLRPMVMEQGIRFTLRDGNVTLRTGAVAKMFHMLSKKERKVLTEGKKARERSAKAAEARKHVELFSVFVRVSRFYKILLA